MAKKNLPVLRNNRQTTNEQQQVRTTQQPQQTYSDPWLDEWSKKYLPTQSRQTQSDPWLDEWSKKYLPSKDTQAQSVQQQNTAPASPYAQKYAGAGIFDIDNYIQELSKYETTVNEKSYYQKAYDDALREQQEYMTYLQAHQNEVDPNEAGARASELSQKVAAAEEAYRGATDTPYVTSNPNQKEINWLRNYQQQLLQENGMFSVDEYREVMSAKDAFDNLGSKAVQDAVREIYMHRTDGAPVVFGGTDDDTYAYANNADKLYEQAIANAVSSTGLSRAQLEALEKQVRPFLSSEEAIRNSEETKEWARQNLGTGIAATVGTYIANAPANMMANAYTTLASITSPLTGDEPRSYDAYMQPYRTVQDIRNAVGEELAEKFTTEIAGQNVAQWLYNAINSTIDSGINMAITGGILGGLGLPPAAEGTLLQQARSSEFWVRNLVSNAVMGSGAAVDAFIEAKQRGESQFRSLSRGITAGLIEGFTEAVGGERIVQHILDGNMNWVMAALESFLSEGTEEYASNELNRAIGNWFFQEDNVTILRNIEALVLGYKAAGYEDKEAWQTAALEALTEDVSAFLSGGLSGLLMGGAGRVINNVAQLDTINSAYDNDTLRALANESLEINPNNRLAQRTIERLDEGKKPGALAAVRLTRANENALRNQDEKTIREAVAQQLTERGETGDVEAIASAIAHEAVTGNELNSKDKALVARSENGAAVRNELQNPQDYEWAGGIETERAEIGTQEPTENRQPAETRAQNAEPVENPQDYLRQRARESKQYGNEVHTLYSAYTEGQDPQKYEDSFSYAFDYGHSGTPYTAVQDSESIAYLTPEQRKIAFEAGQRLAARESARQGNKIKGRAVRTEGWTPGTVRGDADAINRANLSGLHRDGVLTTTGAVRGDGVTVTDLNEIFGKNETLNSAYEFLTDIARATGINIVLYRSDLTGAQGMYDKNDPGTIYLDILAGISHIEDKQDVRNYFVMRTFSHEFTHFLEDFNPVMYNEFRSFVLQKMAENGADVNALIEEQMTSNNLSRDKASREVVAEGMTDILPQARFMTQLAEEHKTIFQHLHQKLKDFYSRLKSYFSKLGANQSAAAAALKTRVGKTLQYTKDVVDMFDRVATGAIENYQMTLTGGYEEIVEETTGEYGKASEIVSLASSKKLQAATKLIRSMSVANLTAAYQALPNDSKDKSVRWARNSLAIELTNRGEMIHDEELGDVLKSEYAKMFPNSAAARAFAETGYAGTDMTDDQAFDDGQTSSQYQIRPPYSDKTKSFEEFVDGLNDEARKTYDMFRVMHDNATITNVIGMNGKTVRKLNIAAPYLSVDEWNARVADTPKWKEAAMKIASLIPETTRRNMGLNMDGTLNKMPLEEQFKMKTSLSQRLIDALPLEGISRDYDIDGKKIRLETAGSNQSVGGEAYRRALLNETRKVYKEGKLRQVNIGGMAKDAWGALGFLAVNGKTGASGDFTTLCPQMMFNKGCFYCYRRAAMESGVNNKLVARSVWYTGEILKIKDADIDMLNQRGGLRIQSFGDWMPYFSAQLADLLYDAELRGLQVKIITKEPSMIEYIASLRKQGIGQNLYFNLSADYAIEKAPDTIVNQGNQDLGKINPNRPFMRDEDKTMWWKRAMTVEEANEYRKKYPWVNTRIVATTTEEFLRGLKDPSVDVVTGYHGHIRQYERIDSTTGQKVLNVEPLGDSGMPRFRPVGIDDVANAPLYQLKNAEWEIEYPGKTKTHQQLAQAIHNAGLEFEYYVKTCCITGRCATCNGKCGAVSRSFSVKNATNRDSTSRLYWAEHMQSAVDNPVIDSYEENAPQYSMRITDRNLLNELNAEMEKGEYDPIKNPDGGYIKVYRSVQIIDGKMYAPMNAVDRDENGKNRKLGYDTRFKVWEQATESPEIAQRYMDKHPSAKYAKFDLDGVDNKTGGVAYNPYLHASNLVLNDQFSAAYRRNLKAIECWVPVSEAGAYHAKYAKDTTGWVEWKPGGVAGKLAKLKPEYGRKLFVSRYMLPVREVKPAEVARMYKEYLSGTDLTIPWNVVTPELRRELVNVGVPIDYKDVYQSTDQKTGEKKYLSFKEAFPDERQYSMRQHDADYLAAVKRGDMETAQRMVDEAALEHGAISEDGEPTLLYHSTYNSFTVFRREYLGENTEGSATDVGFAALAYIGHWLSDRDLSQRRAYHGARAIRAYVTILNPYRVDSLASLAFDVTYGVDDIDEADARELGEAYMQRLRADGYDGVVVQDEEFGGTSYIAFDSNQIKSADPVTYDDDGNAIPLSERFNAENDDIRYSLRDSESDYAPTFYSQMARTIDDIKQTKLGASSVVSYLRGRGVKAEEIKWSGIETWLQGKKSVTKEELQQFAAASQLQIEEETRYEAISQKVEEQTRQLIEMAGLNSDDYDVEFSPWDDGELYVADKQTGEELNMDQVIAQIGRENLPRLVEPTRWDDFKLGGGTNYREILFRMPGSEYTNRAMDAHWNSGGILAHARIQDMETNDGYRMLFIDEIQSDWHNEGHKSGYRDDRSVAEAKAKAQENLKKAHGLREELEEIIEPQLAEAGFDTPYAATQQFLRPKLNQRDMQEWVGIAEMYAEKGYLSQDIPDRLRSYYDVLLTSEKLRQDYWRQNNAETPDAPFRDNYTDFVLKRLLRMAAEEGYDAIGWTTAEQQAERWSGEYSEGYRIEYDQDMPKFLAKYGKKWGGVVNKATLDNPDSDTVWQFMIPEEMRGSVLYEGQPQYSLRNINEEHPEATVGLNFRDPTGKHIERLFDKDNPKIYETRDYNDKRGNGKIPGAYLNKLTGIVQTGDGKAKLVGYWQLGDPELRDYEWLRDHAAELGNDGTDYEAHPGDLKWVYPITYVERIDTPREVPFNGNPRARDITGQYDDGQRQERAMSDTSVLALAATEYREQLERDEKLTDAERSALDVMMKRLNEIDRLENDRREQGRLYREHQFGINSDGERVDVDREAAEKDKARMDVLDEKIAKASNAVLRAKNTDVLKGVLQKARRVVERQQRELAAERMKAYRERRNEDAAASVYRAKIHRDMQSLTKWILNPGNKEALRSVPDALKSTVIPFLMSIDPTSKRQLGGKAATKADIEYERTLQKLKDVLNSSKNADQLYSGYTDLPENFTETLDVLINDVRHFVAENEGDYVVNKMNSEQLKNLHNVIKVLKKYVQNVNRFLGNSMMEHVYEAGTSSMSYMRELRGDPTANALTDYVLWQNARPIFGFDRFGEGGKAIYDGFRRGQDQLAFDAKTIIDFVTELYDRYNINVRDLENDVRDIKLGDDIVKMPVSHIMGVYELAKRPHALGHLLGDGIRMATFKNGKTVVNDSGHVLQPEDVEKITSVLTPEQKAVADELQHFMAETGGAWGNSVYVKRFGVERFTEPNYYPIAADKLNFAATADAEPNKASLYALLNMSFTKDIVEGANNRIMIYSIFDVFTNHMTGMAQYHSMALPVLDALKWLNYDDGVGNSVRKEMRRAYGAPVSENGSERTGYAETFVINMLKSLNGTAATGDTYDSRGLNRLHKYNAAQVAYNLRVVMQQPMAITRAGLVVDSRDIFRGLKLRPSEIRRNIEEMEKYSGIAVWKQLGFYDVNISRGMTSLIKQNETTLEKAIEVGTKGAELADRVTWSAMWGAAKAAVDRKTDIEPGSAEYYEAVKDLFEEVIYRTQVVDSVITKSEMMRSKSFFARSLSSFMNEPVTTASMLISGYEKYRADMRRGKSAREAWQANKGYIGKVAAVYAVGQVLLAVVQSIADAWRDDDDYETFLQKWWEAFKGNAIDSVLPFDLLPGMSDLYDLAKTLIGKTGLVDIYGFAPNTVWMQWYDSLVKGWEIMWGKINGESKYNNYTWYSMIYKALQTVSGMTGIPVAAGVREFVTAWNNTVGSFAPSLKVKSYERPAQKDIEDAVRNGYLGEEAAAKALVEDAGMAYSEAADTAAYYAFLRDSAEEITQKRYEAFVEYGQPAGLSADDFSSLLIQANEFTSDKDASGKTISGSKKEKIVAWLDGLGLTPDQKDAMYYALGYAESKIGDMPWHK